MAGQTLIASLLCFTDLPCSYNLILSHWPFQVAIQGSWIGSPQLLPVCQMDSWVASSHALLQQPALALLPHALFVSLAHCTQHLCKVPPPILYCLGRLGEAGFTDVPYSRLLCQSVSGQLIVRCRDCVLGAH